MLEAIDTLDRESGIAALGRANATHGCLSTHVLFDASEIDKQSLFFCVYRFRKKMRYKIFDQQKYQHKKPPIRPVTIR